MFKRVRRKLGKSVQETEVSDKPQWSQRSWQGSVIRAIVQSGKPLTWREIQESTYLDEKSLNRALTDLRSSEEVYRIQDKHETFARYQVSDRLYRAYSEYYNPRTELIKWIDQWKEIRKLDFSIENKHFFLEGRHLDDFSKELISHAKFEVLVANPFIQECDLSNTLRDAKKRKTGVHIITRCPEDKHPEYLRKKQEYHSRLMQDGIPLVYEERVHAKLIVTDRAVAVISSMNFYADSSAGASWEVGIVSTDTRVVESIAKSFFAVRGNMPTRTSQASPTGPATSAEKL